MELRRKGLLVLGLLAMMVGCSSSEPSGYSRERPPVDSLDEDDSGLQSKDVVVASDTMARDLLAEPKLRQSREQWVMVVDQMQDHTVGSDFSSNFDIFLRHLRSNLARHGAGSVQLITNKQDINQLRNKEWDAQAGNPQRIQPDFALHGRAYDMPNRRTNYYFIEFTVTDMRTGAVAWTNKYDVKVAR